MNRRLTALAALVQNGTGLIDVGTDHGYLPVWLAKNGYAGKLFASDIKEGPLLSARRTAEAAGLTDRICFLLCDGLALCPPDEIDTIVIAGMGGDMIVKILDEAEWCMNSRYHLILQPMTKAEVLRYWLVYNGFGIDSETLVEDNSILYQIISTRFGGSTRLSDAELFIGKHSLCNSSTLFEEQISQVIARFEKSVNGMSGRREEPRRFLYKKILEQLTEMKGKQ